MKRLFGGTAIFLLVTACAAIWYFAVTLEAAPVSNSSNFSNPYDSFAARSLRNDTELAILLSTSIPTPTRCPASMLPTPVVYNDTVPTLQEVYKTIKAVYEQKVSCVEYDNEAARNQYVKNLVGKSVSDWQGWVSKVEKMQSGDSYEVVVEVEQPTDDSTPSYYKGYYAPIDYQGYYEPVPGFAVRLINIPSEQRGNFNLGQDVRFSGEILQILTDLYSFPEMRNYQTIMVITQPSIKRVGLDKPPPSPPADLSNVIITLDRGACYGYCAVYSLRITLDGINYSGERCVSMHGSRTAPIKYEQLRTLVQEALDMRYFSLDDSYDKYMVTDQPSAVTSVTIGQQTKRIHHYMGDGTAPISLENFERKIDEITNSSQWVAEGPDDDRAHCFR